MSRARLGAALCVAACTAGDLPPSGPIDAAGVASGDARADARMLQWVDAAPGSPNTLPCENRVTPTLTGEHNSGKSCFQSCHNHGFTLAGTLYTNATGNTAFTGATITIVDANNVTWKYITQQNGNFYTRDTLAFPVLTLASSCPSAVRMQGEAPNGNCNADGCHPGASSLQMHLP